MSSNVGHVVEASKHPDRLATSLQSRVADHDDDHDDDEGGESRLRL